jgi:hypothetical protein
VDSSLNEPAMDLNSIEAQFELELITSDQLPSIAIELIGSGIESKSLVQLSALCGDELADAPALFRRALNELARGQMSKESALRQFTKDTSIRILKGEIAPYSGAKLIWKTCHKVPTPETHDFDPFIYAASEWEDRPRHRRIFEKGILEEARRWSSREL